VKQLNLVGFELDVFTQLALQPTQGFDALGKDDQSVTGVGLLPTSSAERK